eukprot:1706404-Prymnesium_polylepis.1
MPIDPNRQGAFGNAGAPPLCSCVMAYHSVAPAVRKLLLGAASRLVSQKRSRLNGKLLRQGDQEMLFLQWVEAQPSLRVLALPEEYFCPQARGGARDEARGWGGERGVALPEGVRLAAGERVGR